MANHVHAQQHHETGWVGWIYFAAVFMGMVGIFQMITGLVAIFQGDLIINGTNRVWLVDLATWGWTHLILGGILFVASFSLLTGSLWARVVAVILAVISAIANFAFIPVYPLWSIVMIVIDSIVIYSVIAHGLELEETEL